MLQQRSKKTKIVLTIVFLLIPEVVLLITGALCETYPQFLLQENLLIIIYIVTWLIPIYLIYKLWFQKKNHKDIV